MKKLVSAVAFSLRKAYPKYLKLQELTLRHWSKRTSPKVGKQKPKTGPASGKTDWDTRFLPSVSLPSSFRPDIKKIYIVPATLSERNTKRYRVNHLVEILDDFAELEIVNLYEPPSSFFLDVDAGTCVVILQRLPSSNPRVREFLSRVSSGAALIVYEIDDQVFDEAELESWRLADLANKPSEYREAMSIADHFIVSTIDLRNRIEKLFNKPVHVLHNCLNVEQLELSRSAKEKTVRDNGIFIIGYASGSATHDHDLAVALPAIADFLRMHKDAQFHVIGKVNLPDEFVREFLGRVEMTASVSWRELPAILATFTVQIIPLAFCRFNKFKSHIRYLESAAVGVPVIASKTAEQANTIVDEHSGLLVENKTEAWLMALQRLYADEQFRDYVSETAFRHVESYWCTDSAFRQERARDVAMDLSLGLLRDKISIVLVTYNPLQDVKNAVESIFKHTSVPFELLIWNNSSQTDVIEYINSLPTQSCMVLDVGKNLGKAKGANHLFRIASERFICALDDDYIFPSSWDLKMLTTAKTVPSLGWLSSNLTQESSGIRDRGRTDRFPGGLSVMKPDGVGGWVIFTSSTARMRLGFYREHGLYGGIDGDYNRRARRAGLYTGYVRNVVGQHKVLRLGNLPWELFKQRIQDQMRIHGKDSDLVTAKFEDFFSSRKQYLNIALKICTPLARDENVWGDTHFANGLASALENAEFRVRVDKHEEWYLDRPGEEADIVIHLFGLHKYAPDTKQINILWIISHPDLVDAEFLENYDFIFCASEKTAEMVRALVPDIRVEVLHQCTDMQVFVPDPGVKKDIDVAFVGNSRRTYRDVVRYSIETGTNISIWGTKWEQFIDKKYIKGQSLSSHEVAEIYRRSKVVLNDHWEDQNDFGLVNNRIFDVLSCGTIVLTDNNPGIDDIFGSGALPTFSDRDSFKERLDDILNNPEVWNAKAEVLRDFVHTNHTFRNRASTIREAISYIVGNYVEYKSERQWKKQKAS